MSCRSKSTFRIRCRTRRREEGSAAACWLEECAVSFARTGTLRVAKLMPGPCSLSVHYALTFKQQGCELGQ